MLTREMIPMTATARGVLATLLPSSLTRLVARLMRRELDRTVQDDLALGQVERLNVSAEWVATGNERHDEGPILFVGCGDVTLVLCGQWLLDSRVVTLPFPEAAFFRKFSVQRAIYSGVPFSLTATETEVLLRRRSSPMKPWRGC